MRETQPWLRRASSVAVFVAAAATALAVEQIGHLLLPLVAPALPPPLAGAFDAALIGIVAAIVVRSLVREPLAESERDVASLLAAIPDPVAVVDGAGRVVAANAAAANFGGTDITGRPLFEALPPELARSLLHQVLETHRSGRPASFEQDSAGRLRRFGLTPLDGGGVVVHVADVSESARLKAAAALAADVEHRGAALQEVPVVLRHACAGLLRIFDAPLAWVAGKEEPGTIAVLASAGQDADCESELKRSGHRWDDSPAGRNPIGAAIRGGEAQAQRLSDTSVQDWQKTARRLGARSVAAVPLARGDEVVGALVVGARDADAFDVADLAALSLVAGRLAGAIARAAERQRTDLANSGLDAATNAVFITNRSGVIEWANAAFTRMSGHARQELVGRTPRILKSGEQDLAFYQDLWQTITAGNAWSGEIVERRKDGSLYQVRQTITPLRDFRGEVSHFIAVQEDVTLLREMEERMRHMAQYDALTDLPNRALFFDRLGQGMNVARRNHYSLGVLYLDLDHFRLVNDSFGLSVGDQLLQMVAARLRQSTRESDTVARLAGDEFAVILPQVLMREDAARVAQKILEAMRPPFEIDGQEVHMGVSIGIALYPQDGEIAEQVLARADAAQGVVKMQNRNGYRFASLS